MQYTRNLNFISVRSARINAKERQLRRLKKQKGIEALRAKPPTPNQAINALIGDEEQNEKRKKKKKETGRGPRNPATLDS